MRERLRIFGYMALFWLSFQALIRALFLLYNHEPASTLNAREIFLAFVHGLKMDASISGYFIVATGIVLCISVFTTSRTLLSAHHVLMVVLLCAAGAIAVVDLELYRHWGFRLNTTPLFYAGSEAVGSVPFGIVLRLVAIFVALVSAGIYGYVKIAARRFHALKPAPAKTVWPLLILTGLMFIPIRGSFTVAPMNTGFVYFHKSKTFANHTAINVVWNFFYSLRKSANIKYPEDFYNPTQALALFNDLYETPDTAARLFRISKPNVVLFILESFTADVIEPLGGTHGVTPHFNKLCSQGILFDNFYASGDRTDKGVISILSGYPAQPLTSIIKYPAKTQKLPYLNHKMKDLGYQTSFVYGGDIDFANFRSYFTACAFDHITTEDDFSPEVNESKWGVHDHIVLERAFQECDTATAPFFKVILTLSSHEPFDVPMTSAFAGADETSMFLNSCHYTDRSLGEFMSRAQSSHWWDSTVFIFVADHGHRLPKKKESKERERFRIPLLIAGGAILSDTVIHTIGGQTDIANTLLGQLGTRDIAFKFSKDLVAPNSRAFAAYFFNDGYGFITPGAYIIHDNTARRFLRADGASQHDLEMSKAYQQVLYTDYNSR